VRRVTLDANVLAPAFLGGGGASARLVGMWQEGLDALVLSEHLLRELARTFKEPYFVRRMPPDEATAALSLLSADAHITEPSVSVDAVATHPEDDLILSAALSGHASILCTRHKQLLRLREYQDVSILSPGELRALLENETLT
jgi:putative PIN family toxin of toxin-antitoxin system